MPIDQSVVLAVGVALIAAVAGVVAWATASAARSQPGASPRRDQRLFVAPEAPPRPGQGGGPGRRSVPAMVTPGSARQVARVVAFLFLASVALVAAVTRAWPEAETAIFALIATGVLLVVLFMDMLPPTALGRWRHPIEGLGAIGLLGLLMALTGGIGSPFVVGFYLVVAGTALSAEGLAPLAIALVAALTVAAVGIITTGAASIDAAGLAWIGVNAVGLVLVADLSAAAARAQRMARDEALRASRFDALTGLFNRAFFATVMEQEIRRSERMDRGFALLMLDLDDLKPVNDTFGHQWGDRLIKAVADTLRQTIRFTDSAARYGGDEFIVLLPETDASGAYIVAETLRREIAALTLRVSDRNVRSSVSIGLVTYPQDGTTIEQLVAAADVAMYESKRRGKNQIVGYRTRTERVATAIDVAAAELVPAGPSGRPTPSVRVGGDAAPWAPGPRASAAEAPSLAAASGPPVGSGQGPDAGGSSSGPAQPAPSATTPAEPSAASAAGDAGGSGGPPDAGPSGAAGAGSASGSWPGAETPAWLTRPQPPPPAPRPSATASTSPAATPPDRPDRADVPGTQADVRTTPERRPSSRDASRSEEIRRAWDASAHRPWIALPIDRREGPDAPEQPSRLGDPPA